MLPFDKTTREQRLGIEKIDFLDVFIGIPLLFALFIIGVILADFANVILN